MTEQGETVKRLRQRFVYQGISQMGKTSVELFHVEIGLLNGACCVEKLEWHVSIPEPCVGALLFHYRHGRPIAIRLDPLISQLSTTAHHNELSIGERQVCSHKLVKIRAARSCFDYAGHKQGNMGSNLSFSAFAHRRSLLAQNVGTEEHPFHPLNERLPLPNYKDV